MLLMVTHTHTHITAHVSTRLPLVFSFCHLNSKSNESWWCFCFGFFNKLICKIYSVTKCLFLGGWVSNWDEFLFTVSVSCNKTDESSSVAVITPCQKKILVHIFHVFWRYLLKTWIRWQLTDVWGSAYKHFNSSHVVPDILNLLLALGSSCWWPFPKPCPNDAGWPISTI